jgi:hypothetical protein
MAHPANNTSEIFRPDGLKAYLDRQRAHALAGSDGYHAMAWELRRAVERMDKGSRFGGVQTKFAARRLTRPLFHAAALAEDQAKMFALVWAIHNGIFVPETEASGANVYKPNG